MSVLLTGATGFVGMEILARYLERTDAPVFVAVRARDRDEAETRVDETLARLFGSHDKHYERARPLRSDSEQPGLLLGPRELVTLLGQITHTLHCAAWQSEPLPPEQS